jgi:putative Holliday junction resolvase
VTRLLGVDLGERRIGIAVGDTDAGIAMPLATLRRAGSPAEDAVALDRLVEEHDVDAIVVGLPLHANGDEGTQATSTRTWLEAVSASLTIPMVLRDERLTSHVAEQRLGPMKRGRSGGPPSRAQRNAYRARVDREAAAIILQDELDARRALAASSTNVDDRTMETNR